MTHPVTGPSTHPVKLARTLRFDDSDTRVFARPAEPGEWAVPGAFEFADWTEADLTGKARQAFANGWLGLDSFGRATLVAVAEAAPREVEALTEALAAHFVEAWGAPGLDAARPVAEEEIAYMASLCAGHAPNTLLVVERRLVAEGVAESFRAIRTGDATLDIVAVHGTLDED